MPDYRELTILHAQAQHSKHLSVCTPTELQSYRYRITTHKMFIRVLDGCCRLDILSLRETGWNKQRDTDQESFNEI